MSTQPNENPSLALSFGHNSQQGVRPTMEDAVVLQDNFIVKNSKCTSENLALFAVFDGHGGNLCAAYCANNISKYLAKYLASCDNVKDAIGQAIHELDEDVIRCAEDGSGSTCTFCLIDKSSYDIWIANVGDSRCILISKTNVQQMSVDHKPDNPKEKNRIEQADGWVSSGRVIGILAMSRSLGDRDLKSQKETLLVSTPSIMHHKLTENDMYVVVACDGLFDVYENNEVPIFVNQVRNSNPNLSLDQVAQQLVTDAINVRESKDNVSVIIVELNMNGKNLAQ
jgi:serine/threonine protein phosphatase PrpC